MSSLRLILAVIVLSDPALVASAAPPADDWSEAVNGLQARITLGQRPAVNGTRLIVPYLELRNVQDGGPLLVRCSRENVQFELIDKDGEKPLDGQAAARTGAPPDPGTVTLPDDSSIRIGMYRANWGIPGAAAMIAVDSGCWVLQPPNRARVSLRAVLKGAPDKSNSHLWHGEIVTPSVTVDWKE